ncbi:MAG: right-handed parallel beta-helix repeat-containing protein, partial [Candidatus Latescibacterota bacterium]
GNYSGAMFIQECDQFTFRQVTARNYHGDGFSFQVCDDIHFEKCRAENNESRGFHPGSGSQRPVFRGCEAIGNTQGIFFCWGVSDGLVTECVCSKNHHFGISIGHRDTDNHIVNTSIEHNGKVGVLFREPTTDFRGGHRNEIVDCVIQDNGQTGAGIGVDMHGLTCNVIISNCKIADTGLRKQTVGIRIASDVVDLQLDGNQFVGLKTDIER